MLLVVFKSVDNMLHFAWDYVFDNKSCPERHELTLKAFSELDNACRQLAVLAGYPKTNILLCSDHGHGPVRGHLFVNRLFFNWGLLKPLSKAERLLSKALISYRKRLGVDRNKRKPSANVAVRMKVKWNKSKAAMISGVGASIYLNVKGRQPNGVVAPEQYHKLRDDIVSKLKCLKDKTHGTALIRKIRCPSQASPKPGPSFQLSMPDILLEPADGVVLRRSTKKGPVWQRGRPDYLQGCHFLDGFVLGAGPAFAKGAFVEGDLYDIAPTALSACGLPIPCEIEGKPIVELIANKEQIKYEDRKESLVNKSTAFYKTAYSGDEEELITQQLKDLGYME